MTVQQVFSTLIAHMRKGLMIHDQIASAYCFLNLYGYKKCHEYHFFEESNGYRRLYNYYLQHYNKLIPQVKVEKPETIPASWYKYERIQVNTNNKRSAIKDLMTSWIEWEKETKIMLQASYKTLLQNGDIGAALKISQYLKDVSEELRHAQQKQINLQSINYDIVSIIEQQDYLYNLYQQKIKNIYGE